LANSAYDVVNPYPKGRIVTVFYNPDSPNISLLIPGIGFVTYLPLLVGIGTLLFGLIVSVTLMKNLFILRRVKSTSTD
jgi:hypothetical protein